MLVSAQTPASLLEDKVNLILGSSNVYYLYVFNIHVNYVS